MLNLLRPYSFHTLCTLGLPASISPCPYVPSVCMLKPKRLAKVLHHVPAVAEFKSSHTFETIIYILIQILMLKMVYLQFYNTCITVQ
jgi:hypothetical protein